MIGLGYFQSFIKRILKRVRGNVRHQERNPLKGYLVHRSVREEVSAIKLFQHPSRITTQALMMRGS
jgi:hypothetical protein